MSILTDYCAKLLQEEGGKATNPSDPAANHPRPAALGPVHTNKGITWQTFEKMAPICNYEASVENFLSMPTEIWDAIFQKEFWGPACCEKFTNDGVKAIAADCAFNSGEFYEDEWLQLAVNDLGGNLVVDGEIGPKTIAAVNACNAKDLIKNLNAERLAALNPIWNKPATQQTWQGLQNRCNGMRDWALARA